ncbi:Uma2 family endonuclease [Streptomyces thermodiastaticus]|jgi:Uma2 family endonuclease|uniref:Uma2 family endonuclease n=1 Tax=Streptomyces thermodiastaticus TaxID=44061 RepID=UPI0016729B04|nr:Uma2 family endonuclease [Streptomyces thermodiastaticus]MCE7550197.1 Uma2 family endonuclease [Streptomyces thermodiastaticus]GHF68106.1 membrane protein [Streptomyces thermodiastaticus]
MSAASVEQPFRADEPFSLTAIAEEIRERHPGYRVEIIGGHLLVTSAPDAPHAVVLTDLMIPFLAAGLHGEESKVVQSVAIALPTGDEDYCIPDLAVVDAGIDDHVVANNAHDPVCFRLVLEVTSNNRRDDLKTKVTAYAEAKVPVYVVVDRKHRRLHVLTEPDAGAYTSHRVHAPGETVTLPDLIGAEVVLDVARILTAGRPAAG